MFIWNYNVKWKGRWEQVKLVRGLDKTASNRFYVVKITSWGMRFENI